MSFAGVSKITDGKLWSSAVSAIDTATASGYHLLLVEGYSRTRNTPNGKSISSCIFMVGRHRWRIHYYPNGENSRCASFISLYIIHIGKTRKPAVEVQFELSFIDQVEKQDAAHVRATKTCSFSNRDPCWGCGRFIRRDALERSKNLKGDCFTVRCDITVNTTAAETTAAPVCSSSIRQDLSHLLETKAGADVTFEAGGETFAAHRCVLAARSRAFAAELFGPMKEGSAASTMATVVVQIEEMDADVFRALLSFIYTDLLPEMEMDHSDAESEDDEDDEAEGEEEDVVWLQWLQRLFVAADRYDLRRLKLMCEERLSEHMGVSSLVSILLLAERHHCRGLEEACLRFIRVQPPASLQRVMATHGWEQLCVACPSVLNYVIAKLVSIV